MSEAKLHRSNTPSDGLAKVFAMAGLHSVIALILITITAVAVTYLRYEVIENAALGRACVEMPGGVRCALQATTILLFNLNVFGWAALLMAGASFLRPTASLLTLTGISAVLGLVLYNTTAAALACGIASLAFARAEPQSRSASKG